MTTTPTAGYRMRIAISSPEIEARIRGVFASRGLDVVLADAPPTFEVTVLPGPGPRPAPTAVGDALQHLVGGSAARRTAPRRDVTPSARYRLTLSTVARDDAPPAPHRGHDAVADLSPRESQVMACVARGMRNTEIAAELGVTVKTVKNHVNRIFGKLGVDGRVEAVLAWQSARSAQRPSVRSSVHGVAPTGAQAVGPALAG
ncbi:transcriptional regulator, LuxR family [Cellulomonas flavigena DSM 20109]|uniref:Transcriptional regulator, LuxR family n=1 Tax=Cellulomonas flavigena (strain ATCC 482 / DSM 20109 / BCRC 11376 / JCM 18109 / NBRC 3775 / NCIMB 8073 / NRS 134) TaxID=446466 RepID=D5UCN6_CELFN|nr:helix-turn-helix transcriptional regulator [Cellulomonas flavigena]ADG76271.1 transcriptional regulator, LuxR family [Cellulomonas flavigena DSM 20109]